LTGGLGLYLVPGWPDWETSEAALDAAVRAGVAFVEFPVVGDGGWSPRTGALIAEALEHAGPELRSWSARVEAWIARAPHPVGIVYGGTWPEPARWTAPGEALAASSALLFEDDPDAWTEHARQAEAWGSALVCAVSGMTPELSDEDRRLLAAGGGFVYVSLGTQTGDRSATPEAMRAKVEAVRAARPDLPVFCAFGLREPEDVREVREATGCDGTIVGTGALEVLSERPGEFAGWLDAMVAA
jgi:tryptophan synthase alpha subunit